MTQLEAANTTSAANNRQTTNHLISSTASSSPLISTQNKLINALGQRVNTNNPKGTETDFSINLSSIQHAIDNTENIHNYTSDINEADFSYKNLLSTKIDNDNGYNTNTPSSMKNLNNDIKVQVYYCGKYHQTNKKMHSIFSLNSYLKKGIIMVVYIHSNLKLVDFLALVSQICKFDKMQLFTIKWVDEEGDPCTLSSQVELDEAVRLYYVNKESELIIHIFANIPEQPGSQCVGEDRSIYRRGARRWRKIYLVNGHKYQAKRFARTALCKVCQDRIWGLGRQGL